MRLVGMERQRLGAPSEGSPPGTGAPTTASMHAPIRFALATALPALPALHQTLSKSPLRVSEFLLRPLTHPQHAITRLHATSCELNLPMHPPPPSITGQFTINYLGCYEDQGDILLTRAVSTRLGTTDPVMTVEKCSNLAWTSGYLFFGVQFGNGEGQPRWRWSLIIPLAWCWF
jgi:hypothetical protein